MKLSGEFVLREVADEILAIPVGSTAARFNGMIMLNAASQCIWNCLEQETTLEAIVAAVTDRFDVSAEEAQADIQEFLNNLRNANLLAE